MANDITFRRIGGRIVPIKLTKTERKSSATVGASHLAAGVATAGVTGVAVSTMVRKANTFRVRAKTDFRAGKEMMSHVKHGQMNLFSDAKAVKDASNLIKKGTNKRYLAMKMFKTRNRLLLGGATVAAGLIGSGLSKIRESITGKKNTGSQEALTRAAGVAAGAGVYGAYYSSLPVKGAFQVASNVMARFAGRKRPFQATWWK